MIFQGLERLAARIMPQGIFEIHPDSQIASDMQRTINAEPPYHINMPGFDNIIPGDPVNYLPGIKFDLLSREVLQKTLRIVLPEEMVSMMELDKHNWTMVTSATKDVFLRDLIFISGIPPGSIMFVVERGEEIDEKTRLRTLVPTGFRLSSVGRDSEENPRIVTLKAKRIREGGRRGDYIMTDMGISEDFSGSTVNQINWIKAHYKIGQFDEEKIGYTLARLSRAVEEVGYPISRTMGNPSPTRLTTIVSRRMVEALEGNSSHVPLYLVEAHKDFHFPDAVWQFNSPEAANALGLAVGEVAGVVSMSLEDSYARLGGRLTLPTSFKGI